MDEDVRTLLGFYDAGRSAGGFDQGIQRALAGEGWEPPLQ